MAPRVHRGVFGLAYPQGAKKIGAFGAEPGIEPGTSCMLALRGARRRRGPKTGIIPLCWNPFDGFDHSAECPKAKIYRWRRKILRPAHLWGEVFSHEKVTYIQS